MTNTHPIPTTEQLTEAAKLRAASKRQYEKKEESFDRCDTDGFLSQWASGLEAQRLAAQAEILEHGGYAEHPALFHLDGTRARAKLTRTKYGTKWMVLDASNTAIAWLTVAPARESTLARKGFREGTEWAPSRAVIRGEGRGLSGTCWVAVERTDGGYPADAR